MFSKHRYDAFISHAVEDKIPIANELCRRLEEAGLQIWYSGKELMPGDSLEKTIYRALDQSRYGVVILSKRYLEKNWTMQEFYRLLGKEIEHRRVVIPVLFNITVDELQSRNMDIADRWAIPYDKGMDYVVQKIMAVVKPTNRTRTFWEWVEDHWYAIKLWIALIFIVGLVALVGYQSTEDLPSEEMLQTSVEQRVQELLETIEQNDEHAVSSEASDQSSITKATEVYNRFANTKSRYRNIYEFINGRSKITSRKNVEKALNLKVASLNPGNGYGFYRPNVLVKDASPDENNIARYAFFNTQPVKYEITKSVLVSEGLYEIYVSFKQNIRCIEVELQFPQGEVGIKKHYFKATGFLPVERLSFEKRGEEWVASNER